MPPQLGQSGYFEQIYQGPYKGINVSAPENMIPENMSPLIQNFILKNAELRTRPRMSPFLLGTPDNYPIDAIDTFQDSNTAFHTVMVNRRGLWQLNPNFAANPAPDWNLIGIYPTQPGPDIPSATAIFLNKFYWTNGGNNLWVWDGITSSGVPPVPTVSGGGVTPWTQFPWTPNTRVFAGDRVLDKNGNVEICTVSGWTGTGLPILANGRPTEPSWPTTVGGTTKETTTTPHLPPAQWVMNGKPAPSSGFYGAAMVDALNGVTAGAFFLGVLASRLLMLSTIEGSGDTGVPYPQRLRWSASGQPELWDAFVNIGAGWIDFLEVPDFITGFLAIGDKTGFIFRNNGISEMTSVSDGILPFDFNHLWASQHGIGNVFPFSISSYGPVGMFIAEDDVYNISIGGFKNVGGMARDAIFSDIGNATSTPLSTMIGKWNNVYSYLIYILAIPFGSDTKFWMYSLEDGSWVTWLKKNVTVTARAHLVATR